MKRMPKYVPEIRVSAADNSRRGRMENDSQSECAMSDVATDCETLEASYSKKSRAVEMKIENRDEDVLLTDIDASSDDERETVVRYPLDCINSILDLGMSCEEVSSSQGPNKRQKSITCSLERSKPRSLNADKFDEGGTDVEGLYMSEDEEPYTIDSDNDVQDFEPAAYVSIADKVVTGTIITPRVTPEPYVGRKKRSSNLSAPVPISSVLTDTEMIISDTESNSTRSRKLNKVKTSKSVFDGFGSDTDSDSSAGYSFKANSRTNKKISVSRSFDNIRNSSSSSIKNSMLAPIRKMEDGILTDTEQIYLDDGAFKVAGHIFETRPSVIRMNKPIQNPEPSTVRYRHSAVKSKPQTTPQVIIYSPKKWNETKSQKKQPGFNLNVPIEDDTGNATDVEAFGSDSDDQPDTIKPVAYLPNPKCELIIDNESHKGKMSIILPITESQKGKSLRIDDMDCGYSDVEDLPGFEAEEYFRYPTPELPRTEHSTVENKEVVIDKAKLRVEPATKEPVTDTEDLDLTQDSTSGNRLKVKLNHLRKNRDINECHTDVEDLDGSDTENTKMIIVKNTEDVDQVELTDVGELSSDDSDNDDRNYRFTAVSPDLEINNTYTNARESMSPFSFDVRRKVSSETVPRIRMISPSPIPRNTSSEDFLASHEESAGSNWASDDGHIESHSSQVHIKHTRKFNIDQAEMLHIKGYCPDPTTDVEEISIFEALEELRQKKRKHQKSKEQNEGTAVKICYSGPRGPSCKPNTRISKTSGRHDDKPRGADKSKGAVESSWLSLCDGESVDGGMSPNAGGLSPNTGGGLKSPYDNVNSVYYKEMADESVYPPQLGYAEFESPDVLGSTSSLTQEHGTDTFSELLFSSSNSESEEPDENFPVSREYETCGILYDMSSHINKVPEMFAKRTRASAEARPGSPQDLESRLKYYHNLCNRSLSPEVQGVSPAERAELKELEESISQMLIDIRREESLFYSDNTEEATNTIKKRPKPKKEIQDEKYKKMNDDGETALKEIESHISKLLQDVEREEREVMGSLRRNFRKSPEKLESVPSPWDMINATTSTNDEGAADVSYVRFRDSSCTPSPVESSSTSEDEYDVVPRVELNIGNRLGRSTIDISVKNSPTPRRKSTRMSASKRSLNRSLPSLKSSSMFVWSDHNSTECLIESPTIWQSSSVEYISPSQQIEPGSGYCIWSYPSEDDYGQDQETEDVKKTPVQEKTSKEPPKDQKTKDKGKRDDLKKEPLKKNEKSSLDRKDSSKRVSPDKTPEPPKKVSPVKVDKKPLERKDSKKTPSPEKSVSTVTEKKTVTKVKSTEESTTTPCQKVTTKSQKSHEKTDEKLAEVDSSQQKVTEKTKTELTKSETTVKDITIKDAEEKGKGKQKKGKNEESVGTREDQRKSEERITKQAVEPAKGLKTENQTEKKSTILGKTIETIKKPFQGTAKDEKGKGKGKGKGKQKSIESIKTPSQEIDESTEVQDVLSSVEEKLKTATDLLEPTTGESLVKVTSESSRGIQEPVVDPNIVETSKEIIGEIIDEKSKVAQNDKTKGKGKSKVPEPPKTISLSRTTSQEQEKSIKDTKDGKTALKDNGKGKNGGSPKESKGVGKGQEKIESPKAAPIKKGAAKVDDLTNGADKGTPKDATAKGRGKLEPVKLQLSDRPVVEPLIEKTVQDITVIAVGSVDKGVKEEMKKDDKGSPKEDKNKGKGKDKCKDKPSLAKTPSTEETDKLEKSDTTLVGKTVEIIKKPFQEQTKPTDETKASTKPGKGKKPQSVESSKSSSLDKSDADNERTELENQSMVVTKIDDKTMKPENDERGKKDGKSSLKDDKTKGKGKGKQKSTESDKSPSPEKDTRRTAQNESKVESTAKEQKSPDIVKKDDKKKGKGKQKSIESPKTPSLEKEEDSLAATEPTLIEKTLETIKRPFQGKKDDKTVSKQVQAAEGKKGKGKSKQKSVESTSQSSTEQEPKQETTTETVRLIKDLSLDKSGQVIEEKAIDLVSKPFGDKPPLFKSNEPAPPHMEGTTKTATLLKELSQEKSSQRIEGKAIEVVSEPFEHTPLSTGSITTTAVTLTKELSQEKSGQMIEEKGIDLASQPLQQVLGTQIQSGGAAPSPEGGTTSTSILIEQISQGKSGKLIGEKSIDLVSESFEQKSTKTVPSEIKITTTSTIVTSDKPGHIEGKEIDLVSTPLHEILGTAVIKEGLIKSDPLITELSREKSGFIIEERPIDLVSQPFQGILGTKSAPLPSVDAKVLPKAQIEEKSSTAGPLIKELSHEKSGFIIEERAIDLVSQPFQRTLETSSVSVPTPSVDSKVLSKTKLEEKSLTADPLIKELSNEKSGFIIEERPIDLVSQPFQGILETSSAPLLPADAKVLSKTQIDEKSSTADPLIKELSNEKSGFIIEERPIDLVSQPFQGILETSSAPLLPADAKVLSKTRIDEKSSTAGPLIKELSHEKSGFIIEERPIDLVSQPFQDILGTRKSTELPLSTTEGSKSASMLLEEQSHDAGWSIEGRSIDNLAKSSELPPSSLEGSTRAVSLMKALSQDKSGQVIEESAIDLVAQPFLGIGRKEETKMKKKESKSKTGNKKGDESTVKKNDFEHIQKTIDDAKSQFDQFVGIVSDKVTKSSEKINNLAKEKEPTSTTVTTTTSIRPLDIEGEVIIRPDEQDVNFSAEKEDGLLRIQETIQQGIQRPAENIGTIEPTTITTTVTKPIEQEPEKMSVQSQKLAGAVDKDVKKVTETIKKSVDGGVTVIEKTIESQVKPLKDASGTLVEKTIVRVQGYLPKIGDAPVDSGKVTHEFETLPDDGRESKVQEAIKAELQSVPSKNVAEIDVKTITTTVTKPIEREAENISIQAGKVVGTVDEELKKVSESVKTSVDGGVTLIEQTIDSRIKPFTDASGTFVEKSKVTVQGHLPKIDTSFLGFGEVAHESLTLGDVEEGFSKSQQGLKDIPSENIAAIDVKTAITKPMDQAAQNIPIQTQKAVGLIDQDVKKVTECVRQSAEGGDVLIQKTIESLVKPAKDGSATLVEKTVITVREPVDGAIKSLEKIAHESAGTIGKSQNIIEGGIKGIEKAVKEHIGKVTEELTTEKGDKQSDLEADSFHPALRAQSVKIATFETVETIPPVGTKEDEKTSNVSEATGTASDEIGRIIKEMESQLLSTKFGMDESTIDEGSEVESEEYTRESRTMPTTPMPARKMFGDTEAISDSEVGSKPYVTTPTLSRRVIGLGGSQRLSQEERPVVRVITEYVGDLSESEPEEDTYTVLEPEVKERRKFKIRFSPDMYGSEDKEEVEEGRIPDTETIDTSEALKKSDSIKSEKNIKRIERKFERMTSQTKEADPSMSEVTDGEFQRIVSQLSLEEMDQALYQWDVGGLTPSEIDSKDFTLSSDDTTSPLQQGLTDIFRPKLSSILPTSIYVEKTGTEVGSSGHTESSKMKLSLVKDSVPQIFQSVETDSQVREGSHTLEPGETGETPPIPSPRTPLKPTDSQDKTQDPTQTHDKDDEESKNYATRKMFWEQMSSGSIETAPAVQEVTPPVPKPRARSSISLSIDAPDEKKAMGHSEASIDQEVSEIGESEKVLHGVTTTESVARDSTTERGISLDGDTTSELEFIRSHDIEELSYDNDAFDDETIKDFPFPEPKQRKAIFERSVSLPGDTTIDASNNVRSKKRIFEAQIKKEMVVEQLMSQMEEEGSPEHKAFEMTTEPTDQAAMLNRNIHSEIVSHELEEQIESNILENKALVQNKTEREIQSELKQKITLEASPVKTEDDASESDKTNDTSSELPSIYETKISSTVAEVLHYKNDAISTPSDSLEVHVDKSELEDTEKVRELEDELKIIGEKFESHQLASSEQAKVSSITSSQGESEDTFSESDVTPEDARFKEQHDIQVWGPSDKDVKLSVDKADEQKKQRSVHTPEEHIPDTVWEVPVQENTEPLEVETVGQLPTAVASWQESEALTESEARKIAEIFVGEIESELTNKETMAMDASSSEKEGSKIKTPEKTPTSKKSENMLKLIRTDTTTSSMEITDEDLRSSGMTDNSPLESQAGHLPQISGQHDVFGEDSGDDVDAQELDRDTIGKDVVDKTLAEVKQSLEAVKVELIEEKKKKRDSITKESPSEFEFKALVLEKTFSESIQEHHQEEATTIESKSLMKTSGESSSSRTEKSELSQVEETYSSFKQTSVYGSKTETSEHIQTSEKAMKYQEPSSHKKYEELSKKEEFEFEEHKTSSSDTTSLYTTSAEHDILREQIIEPKEVKTPGSTTGSEVSIKSTKSQDTVIERESYDKQEPSTMPSGEIKRTEKVTVKEDVKDELSSQIKTLTDSTETSSKIDLESISDPSGEPEERKSPLDDVFSNSSSSDYKGGSNDASTLDKPNIIIRKHKKSTLGTKDQKSDGELYSSSGSHYESFEQTSESIKSPGSRPLSSDVEGLVAAAAGMTTGSSEYESAVSHEISGQSTTITSREYQTAVSSLSSRDSMKSLDSESSGNLASIEVSSEASETLVPSAMELEKDSEEPVIKPKQIAPFTVESQVKPQSFSESIEQSVSFDISGEDMSEDDDENQVQPDQEQAIRMKRSHEMTFQPEPRPIVLEGGLSQGHDDKLASSLDDMSSLVSTTTDTGNRTVIELSKTESERMDGSATSDQLSLTVSGTSDLMSLSESRELEETTVLSRTETIATQSPPFQQPVGGVESVTITTSSIIEQGIQSVCTQVTSKVETRDVSHSNGPTQVDYNAEYDEGDHEVKKRGHRRNGSTSFRPSMIPVFQVKDTKKKTEDIIEDTAESDKYTQPLTVKEGRQEEKKDVDETERLEEEFYKTEADQAMNRDLREGRISIADTSYGEGAKSFDSSLGTKSRLHSAAFSDDHPDSEIAELLKQCSSDIPSEDPIERPKTPEPVEECELKDDTPEFSSEAQASVTELEMEYSGAFSRSAEYAAHVSPIREKGLPAYESWEHLSEEGEQTVDDSMIHSPDPLHLGFEDSASEKHELETHESSTKEKHLDRSKSPVPDITVTQHMHPTPQDSFETIEMESAKPAETPKQTEAKGVMDSAEKQSASKGITDEKDDDSASDSPTSDSFELLEKPDIADEFVIIEEVGREASEQDMEGKSVKIDMKRVTARVGSSSAPTVVSPPTTVTKMTQVKYFSSGATEEDIPFDIDSGSPSKSAKSEKESSQEGSPPSAEEPDFKPDLEASKKWMEMQFQGAEPIAQIYGYDMEYERGPLEDIKEEDINDLEGSSKIGSMGSQVSQSIGSYGSVKESLSSTPDYDVLAGRKFFTRSGEHDDVSMSSLQEFERLEHLIAMESSKHKSLGSQDSLTSSSNNSRKHGSRSGGDDVSLASLKEFEGLESACIAAETIEKKAKAEEESLLSEIEEGHESQASESESCATISVGGMQRGESDEDDYERRMFEIDEIIRQAQTNVEQFMDSKSRETLEGGVKSETLGRADSLEEISKVPELDLDQPVYSVSYSSGKSYIQQWEDLGDDLITSTDSLELKTQKSKTSVIDPFTTSTDSLDVKISQDVMSVSTDSIEASQRAKKKDIMTDSIEVGEKTSMLTSVDSLEGKVTQANSIDEDEHHAMGIYDQSSSSGKEGDLSSSGKDDSAEGAVGMNRMPPPRAEYLLGSTDSLEPTSSTATHATYQYETDSIMSSSFTSGDSATMVDDNDEEGAARASMWFDEGKPYVTEVIEPIIGDEEFSHVIHRKVEMPPEIHKVSFKGIEAEHALREYIEKFDPGEDCTETREVDEHGNVHVKRVIQKRVIVRPEELGGDTTDLSGPELEKYLQTLTQTQMETEPLIDTIHSSSESHSTISTTLRTTTTLSQGDSIKTEQEQKQTETHRRGSRPPLKYDISVDEEPEFDPREHDWRFNLHTHIERDEESQEGAYGISESKTKGAKK